MQSSQIRAYQPEDKNQLLDLLALNIPRYFAHSELDDFAEYLQNHLECYYVIEIDGRIVGSGGINYFPAEKTARLSWDVIHPDYQNRGLGKVLTLHRIDEIKKDPGFETIRVRTSQLVYQFYEKMGFMLTTVEKNFWAEGIDLYDMSRST